MKKNNNKGFTLVELIATIVLLAIIMGIGAFSITAVINKSKEKDYELLIKEINNAVELYYQECRYSSNNIITCPSLDDGYYKTTLGDLVKNGFLKGNGTDNENEFTLKNPKYDDNNNDISECKIKYYYNTEPNTEHKIIVSAVEPFVAPCPSDYSIN